MQCGVQCSEVCSADYSAVCSAVCIVVCREVCSSVCSAEGNKQCAYIVAVPYSKLPAFKTHLWVGREAWGGAILELITGFCPGRSFNIGGLLDFKFFVSHEISQLKNF